MERKSLRAIEGSSRNIEQQPDRPAIWVAPGDQPANGLLYGGWVDAAQPPAALRQAISEVLAGSPLPVAADEWSILHQRNFCGLELNRRTALEIVSALACGIARHGEAFAVWARYASSGEGRRLADFRDRYLGRFDDLDDYVRHVIAETERARDLTDMPASLRAYTQYTVRTMARDWAEQLRTVSATAGGVHIFEPYDE